MFIVLSGKVFIEKIESNTVENLLRSLQKEKEESVEEICENKFHEKYAQQYPEINGFYQLNDAHYSSCSSSQSSLFDDNLSLQRQDNMKTEDKQNEK